MGQDLALHQAGPEEVRWAEGRGTVTDSGGGLHLMITLLFVAYQCVPESRSGKRNPGETASKYSLV